jgi:3-oxoacyl-[acyl-carrier protein] reductase
MFSLDGKRALVTGASGGIGAAIARALHAQGATVVCGGRNRAALEMLSSELGERTHVVTADLATAAGCDALAAEATKAAGGLDILVNNAGLTRDGLAMRMSDEDWSAVIDVNLAAAFRLARAAMRAMVRQRWGRIVSITSVVGTTGNPGQANYAASKAGLVGMSKSLAAELAGRNVTVNCVAPGFIETAMTAALDESQRARLMAQIPAGRFGTPADVAACVAFLASEEAAYVTGATLHVNGGMAMV